MKDIKPEKKMNIFKAVSKSALFNPKRHGFKRFFACWIIIILFIAIVFFGVKGIVFGIRKLVSFADDFFNNSKTVTMVNPSSDKDSPAYVSDEIQSQIDYLSTLSFNELTDTVELSLNETETDPDIPSFLKGNDIPWTMEEYYDNNYKGLVILDAGHGGYDGGSPHFDLKESDINLAICEHAKTELQNRGYEVFMTRDTDDFVGLNERCKRANVYPEALCFISIHQNAVETLAEETFGTEVWTRKREGNVELADIILKTVTKATGFKERKVYYRTNLIVTKNTTMPAVIIECGYMSNEEECMKLNSDEYRDKFAVGIANAVDEFRESYYTKEHLSELKPQLN